MTYTLTYKADKKHVYTEEFKTNLSLVTRLNKLLVANYTIINVRMGA